MESAVHTQTSRLQGLVQRANCFCTRATACQEPLPTARRRRCHGLSRLAAARLMNGGCLARGIIMLPSHLRDGRQHAVCDLQLFLPGHTVSSYTRAREICAKSAPGVTVRRCVRDWELRLSSAFPASLSCESEPKLQPLERRCRIDKTTKERA